jgi:S-adenosylmethionine:tRNA ribosyltransferase-isomerase
MTSIEPIDINDYNYDLSDSQIAKYPNLNRDQSKLLIYNNGQITQSVFSEIANYLPENAHLIFNNTKVIPARLLFENKTGAKIEVLLLQPVGESYQTTFSNTTSASWSCMIGNKKKWKKDSFIHQSLTIQNTEFEIKAEYLDFENNTIIFKWENNNFAFDAIINAFGEMPLPPYLNRRADKIDAETYQTVYSEYKGAVAAPTAGLHFTQNVFESLNSNNFTTQYITLHVGAGTFMPVKEENALNHKMHNEQIIFTLNDIIQIKNKLGNIIPVGTTSTRAIESLYWYGVKLLLYDKGLFPENSFFIEKLFPYFSHEAISVAHSLQKIEHYMIANKKEIIIGETEILIIPEYKFKICKGIITNFHQPKSTLLLLISAFVGNKWKQIYHFATENNFRFLSYGDSSLLIP